MRVSLNKAGAQSNEQKPGTTKHLITSLPQRGQLARIGLRAARRIQRNGDSVALLE
jgi:hypothetical protein